MIRKFSTSRGIFVAALVIAALLCALATPASAGDRAALKREVEQLYKETHAFRALFQKSVELVMPSVVSITTERSVRGLSMQEMPFPFRGPFQGDPRERAPQREQEYKMPGLGSGFVVSPDGYIVTNFHVVEKVKAKDIKVAFSNGKEYAVTDVWRDENTEIAVIKIDAKNLPALEWGNSKDLQIGEWVLAIGSPLGFGNTVTTGIVSAITTKDRVFAGGKAHDFGMIRQKTGYAIEDYIQTEAAINPGNSGGPLVTLTGKVIGINTLIVSPTRSSAGLGFSVPEKIAHPVVNQLIRHGKVVRGHLGVMIISNEELTDQAAMQLFQQRTADDLRKEYHILKDDKGVLVAQLVPEAPAERDGLEVGDLITQIDNTPTPDADTLKGLISAQRPDTAVTIILRRKGREKKIKVTLGEQPTTAVAATGQDASGVSVESLTPEVAEFLGYDKELKGVVVTGITRESAAAQAGLQLRDVIVKVNNKPVENKAAFAQAMRATRGKPAALEVKRDQRDLLILLKP